MTGSIASQESGLQRPKIVFFSVVEVNKLPVT